MPFSTVTDDKLAIEASRESFADLEARLLVEAAARIDADVKELQRLGIIDASGRRIVVGVLASSIIC